MGVCVYIFISAHNNSCAEVNNQPENGQEMNAFPKKPQKPVPPEAFGI